MKRLLIMILCIGILNGCRYGASVDSFPPARTPRGVTGSITTATAHFTAELIEVRQDSILILADRKLRLLPYTAIQTSTFGGMRRGDRFEGRRLPRADVRERLRLVSRYPQGMTPGVLRKLLDANGQSDLAGEAP